MIYDEKWQADRIVIEKRGTFVPLHEFTFKTAMRAHPLEFQAYQFCWDLHITGEFHRSHSVEVELFMGALTEEIPIEQVAFMLKCRDTIMKVGVVVGVRSADQSEIIPAFFMNQDQLQSALEQWWMYRYHPRILQHCLEFAVAPPAQHLDSTKRYVAMTDILVVSVMEFGRDIVSQMHELLLQSRIIPRLGRRDFCQFICSLIPYATDQDLDKFYRATVSSATGLTRSAISQKAFARKFTTGSILFAQEKSGPDPRLEELLEVVRQEWKRSEGRLVALRKHFEGIVETQPENNQLRQIVGEALRYETMLAHSLTINNALEACGNYFRLIFAIDTLFAVAPYIDVHSGEASFVSLECCIKEYWLDCGFEEKEEGEGLID
jgi:hypothetical protein